MNTPSRSMRKIICDEIDSTLEDIEADGPMSSDSEILISTKTIVLKKIPLKQLSIVLDRIDVNAGSDSDENTKLRRGTRLRRKPNNKLQSECAADSPNRQQTSRQSVCIMPQDTSTDMSEVEVDPDTNPSIKPTALFTNEDVEGQEMFGFKVSATHRKEHMAKKAKESLSVQKSPSVMKTPHKFVPGRRGRPTVDKTPKVVNAIIRKRITEQIESDQGESDFTVDSSDDYSPDENGSSSDTQQEYDESPSASVQDLAEEEVRKRNVKCATPRAPSRKDDNYFIHSEHYFMMHANKKNITSDHTLERLKSLQISDENRIELEESTKVSAHHQNCIRELSQMYISMFDKWLYVLAEDYNILLYGVGSKRTILDGFRKEKLTDESCIVINGFFPSLTVRSIVESIMSDVLQICHVPSNPMEAILMIDQQLSYRDVKLFVLVHNLDGAMLRNNKAQKFLSQLAKIKRVHMLASVDHINAALICDHSKLSSYKFTWWDATSLLAYTAETSYETSLMVQGSGALALSSLRSVYRSLTSNAKGIYIILAQKQLDNTNTSPSHYHGLPFKELYSLSREAFLVSSDIALRAQLTEFLDHKLVKMKRSADGIETLLIPIDRMLLQQFVDHRESH